MGARRRSPSDRGGTDPACVRTHTADAAGSGARRLPAGGVRALAAGLAVAALAALVGCGGDKPEAEPPQPALVIRAGAPAGVSGTVYSGEIRAREESTLAFRVGGKVLSRRVDVGDRVRAGDVLAELDPGDLRLQGEAAAAQVAAAEAQLARARADHRRLSALAADQLVSRSALDQQTAALRAAEAEADAARAQRDVARNQSSYTRLLAPRDGAIAARNIEVGQVVAAGQTAFSLAVDGEREVAFALPEQGVEDFRVGQPVLVELWNDAGKRLPATLREIAPAADPLTRTYAARARVEGDAGAELPLGLSARVYVLDAAAQGALQLPLSAIQPARADVATAATPATHGGGAVWVVDPKTRKVRRVAVKTGPFGSERVAVLQGLRPGDWVVAAGGHLLREGQEVVPVDRDNRPLSAQSAQ